MQENYLELLNTAQRAAVEYLGGPSLVIAGAGSGKTRVLTYKIVHLLRNGHNPARLMALTFTNKAAKEMRERIEKLVGPETANRLWMGTFHSIFSRILRIHADRLGFPSNFTIYDTSDSKSLIKSIIKELQLDDKLYRPGTILGSISNAKNNLFSPEDYERDKDLMRSDADAGRSRTAEIFRIYRDRCKLSGAMDFDDLLYYTNILLRDNPDIAEHYRNYFSFVLVDEYQDTNFAQHTIIRQLCNSTGNLCVVGDDAQSIYSFRGANIRNILTLKRSFPQLRIFKLEQNYRSTRNILGAANTLIAANTEQIQKEIFSENEAGSRIEVVKAYNEYEEAYSTATHVNLMRMRNRVPFNEIAVLYRTNAQSRIIEEALRNRNIPYRIYGGLSFYQRKEIKDAVCYFRLAINPHDEEAFKRVLNTPKRGIGETTRDKLIGCAAANGVSLYDVALNPAEYGLSVNKGTASKLHNFALLIQGFVHANERGSSALALGKRIIEKSGLMEEYKSENTPEYVSKVENIEELLKAMSEFESISRERGDDEHITLGDYLAQVSLATEQDTDKVEEGVTLMTIHSAKGLEYDSVFIVGCEEDLIPSAMSRSPREVEEERRLMYVAITRAKRFCMISFTSQRTVQGKTIRTKPSRFLSDIDPSYLRMMTGTSIRTRTDRTSRPEPTLRPTSTFSTPSRPAPAPPAQPARQPSADSGFKIHKAGELNVGQHIIHSMFGQGTIENIDTQATDDRISVRFADNSVRTLLLKFAKFKLV